MITNYNKKKIFMAFARPLFGEIFYAFFLGMFFFSFSAHAATARPWDSAKKDSINVATVKDKAQEKATKDKELKKKLLEKLQEHFKSAHTKVTPAADVPGSSALGSTLKILKNKEASIKKLEEKVAQVLGEFNSKQLSDKYKAIVDLSAQEKAKKTMESWSETFKKAFTSHPALIIGGLIVGAFAGYEIYKTAMMGTGIFSRIGSAGSKIWKDAGESIADTTVGEIAGKIKIGDDAAVTVEDLKPPLKTLTDSLLSEVAQDAAVQEATGGLEAASKALKTAAKDIDPTEGAGKFSTSAVLPLTDTDFNRNIADKNADFENIQNVLIKEFKTDEDLTKAATSAKNLKDVLTDEGKVKLKNNLELISQEIDGEIKALKGIRLPEVDVEYEVTTIRANGGGTFKVGKDNLQEWIKVGKADTTLQSSILTYEDPEEKSAMPGYKATRLVVNKEGVVTAKQIIKASGEKEVAEDVPVEKGSELLFERKVAKANDEATKNLSGNESQKKTKREALDDLITPHVVAKALYGDDVAEPSEGDAALIKNPAKTVEQLGEELQLATSPVALAQKFGSQDELAAEEIDRVQKKIKSIDEKYLENKKMLAQQETEIAKKAGGVSEVDAEGSEVKKKKWQVYSDEHKALIQKFTVSRSLTDDQIKKKLTKYEEDKAFHNKPMQVQDSSIFDNLNEDQKNEIQAVSVAIKKLYPSITDDKIKVNYHPTGGLVVYAELEKSKCPVGNGKTIFVTLNNASFDVREPGAIKNRFCWDWKPDNVKVSSETLLKFASPEVSEDASKFEAIAKKSPFNYFVDDRDYNLGDLSSYNDSWMDEFLKTDHLVSFKAIRDSIDDTKVKNLFKDTSANPSDDEINTAKDFIAGQLSLEINGFGNRVGKIEGFSKEDGPLRLKTSKESNVISESGEDYRKKYFSKNFLKDGESGESLKQQSIKSVIDQAFSSQKVHVKVGDKLIAFDKINDENLKNKVKNIVTRQLNHDLNNSRLAKIRETGSFVISRAAEPPSKLKVMRDSEGGVSSEVVEPTQEERDDMSGELKVEYAPAIPQKNLFSALLDESGAIKTNLKGFVNDLSDLQPQEFLDTAVKNAASSISSWFKPFSVMSDDAFRASMYEAAKK